MDKVVKFGSSILIDEGLIKKEVEDDGKITKNGKVKYIIELWKGLIGLTMG
jgi:hypothetical protein